MAPTERSEPSTTVTRRQLLAAVGTAGGVSTAGCSGVLPSDQQGEGDTIEVLVENRSTEAATIAVRLDDRTGSSLFSRVYELESGHLDQSAGVETRPATVLVFTPDGTTAVWDYSPDTNLNCDGTDVGITLDEDGTFESWYGC